VLTAHERLTASRVVLPPTTLLCSRTQSGCAPWLRLQLSWSVPANAVPASTSAETRRLHRDSFRLADPTRVKAICRPLKSHR